MAIEDVADKMRERHGDSSINVCTPKIEVEDGNILIELTEDTSMMMPPGNAIQLAQKILRKAYETQGQKISKIIVF